MERHKMLLGLAAQALIDQANNEGMSLLNVITREFIAPIVVQMPDKEWEAERVVSMEPCDTPGCDCHLFATKIWEGLDGIRKSYKEEPEKEVPPINRN